MTLSSHGIVQPSPLFVSRPWLSSQTEPLYPLNTNSPALAPLSHQYFTTSLYESQEGPLEKEMAIHSSTIAWKIPWIE